MTKKNSNFVRLYSLTPPKWFGRRNVLIYNYVSPKKIPMLYLKIWNLFYKLILKMALKSHAKSGIETGVAKKIQSIKSMRKYVTARQRQKFPTGGKKFGQEDFFSYANPRVQ